jgi:lariat debranching enzyme
MGLLRTLKPAWWFSAHLHAKYEATVRHESVGAPAPADTPHAPDSLNAGANPDEINIDDDDDGVAPSAPQQSTAAASSQNPDEIALDPEEESAAPVAEPLPAPLPGRAETNFLALDKCLPPMLNRPPRYYLEVIYEIPAPSRFGVPLIVHFMITDPRYLYTVNLRPTSNTV